MTKYDRFQWRIKVRRVDARMEAAQTAVSGKAADTPRGSRIAFVCNDQLG